MIDEDGDEIRRVVGEAFEVGFVASLDGTTVLTAGDFVVVTVVP